MQRVSKVRSCKRSKQALAKNIDITLVFSPLGYGVIIGLLIVQQFKSDPRGKSSISQDILR